MAAATFPLLAMLLCAAISSSLAAHFRQEKYNGYQNIYSLSTANHVLFNVGNVLQETPKATKMCANFCTAHDWCGAFYLSLPNLDGGRCHLVPDSESSGAQHVASYSGIGPGHVFYQKEVVTDTEMNIAPELWAPYVSP